MRRRGGASAGATVNEAAVEAVMGSHPQLSKEDTLPEDDNLDIDSEEDKEPSKPLSWREKLAFQLSTNKVQYSIIGLVIFDSIIVIFELLVDMGMITIPESHHGHGDGHGNHSDHLLDNNSHHAAAGRGGESHYLEPSDDAITTPSRYHSGSQDSPHQRLMHNLSLLHQSHNSNSPSANSYSADSSETRSPLHTVITSLTNASANASADADVAGAEVHHTPNKHMVEHTLHIASLVILTIFLVEVVMKILAEGTHLLKHKAEVFDAVVVFVSFTMDITFTFVNVSQATQDYAGLLVLLRLWRVTRIINGVILSVKMDADKKLKVQKRLRDKAEKQVARLNDKVEKLMRENTQLRSQLSVLDTGGSERYSGQDFQSDRASRRSGASGSMVTFQCGDQFQSTASTTATAMTTTLQEGGESVTTPDGDVAAVTFRLGGGNHGHHPHQHGGGSKANSNNRLSGGSGLSSASQAGSNSFQGSCPPPPRSSSASSSLAKQAGSPRGGDSGGVERGPRPSLSKQASFGSSTRYSPTNTTTSSPPDSQRNSMCRDASAGSFSSIPLHPGSSDGGCKPSPGKSPPSSSSYSSFYNRNKSGSAGSLRSPLATPESQQLLSYEEVVSGSTGREQDDPGVELREMSTSSSAEVPLKQSLNSQFVPGVS